MTRFAWLAIATCVATLVLIAAGGLVRATESGLGCPDWPGCSTEWDVHAWVEYSHRAIAGLVVLLMAALASAAWMSRRSDRVILAATLATLVLVLAQAGLGAIVVLLELRAELVTVHLALALGLLALTIFIVDRSVRRRATPAGISRPGLGRLAMVTAGLVGGQMLLGSWVSGRGAGPAFTDFPLMDGSLLPALSNEAEWLHFLHRAVAVVVAAAVAITAVRVFQRTDDAVMRRFAVLAAVLVALQVALGGATVLSGLAAPFVFVHLVVGALLWGTVVALWVSGQRARVRSASRLGPESAAGGGTRRRIRDTVQVYVALTKPRIVELLLVTTLPTMVLAQRGIPSPWLILATLVGGTLAAGSANAINCYIDRRIDGVMRRTRRRPLPSGTVSPASALRFGIVLGIVSFALLWLAVNPLAASLAAAAILFYVFVYTLMLKRSTPQNIVIGGAAGCAPVLVGWAAVTGSVGLPALVLFGIVFYWTPPHFWALALRYRSDYAAAGVPMLPVVHGEQETALQILLYSVLLVAVSLLLLPAARMGAIYLVAATILGGIFLVHAYRVWQTLGAGVAPTRLFRYSISYLALLFGAIGLDSLVRLPIG